mgnify:CR=1 FL=1
MTIEEILARKECQTFDCKSIQIDPKALAIPIVAMANVDGGVLAIDVSEKTIRRDLYVLRDMNLIHYVGSDKTGHWEVIQ